MTLRRLMEHQCGASAVAGGVPRPVLLVGQLHDQVLDEPTRVVTRILDAIPLRTGVTRIRYSGCRILRYGARFLLVVLVSTDTSAILPLPVGRTKSIVIVHHADRAAPPRRG